MSEEFVPVQLPPIPDAWLSDFQIVNFIESLLDVSDRTRRRTGGETDLVNDSQIRITAAESTIETLDVDLTSINDQITSINTEITTLQENINETEELIVLLQKRLKSMIHTLDHKIKCLEEMVETS